MLHYIEQAEGVQRQLAKTTWCPASALATCQKLAQVCGLQPVLKDFCNCQGYFEIPSKGLC